MTINTNTKLIARLHTKENGTGLNIYNPYFEDQGINAVYMLFQNENPEILVNGLRNLNISGAITAGFEHDPELPKLVDTKTKAVEMAQRVGILVNEDGNFKAHYQGGEGLLSALKEKAELDGKTIALVGAGTVASTLLLALKESNVSCNVVIYNRNLEKADKLKSDFENVTGAHKLGDLSNAHGDIFINVTRIGSKVEDTFFTKEIVSKFQVVADVTFGVESTNLTQLAEDSGLTIVSGWDMFTHQAAVVLRHILNHEPNIDRLRYFVKQGLSQINHGAVKNKETQE